MKKKIDLLTRFPIKNWNLYSNSNKNYLVGYGKAPHTVSTFFHFQILMVMETLDTLLIGILIGGMVLVGLFSFFRRFFMPFSHYGHLNSTNTVPPREPSPIGIILFLVCFAILATFLLRTFKGEDKSSWPGSPEQKKEVKEQKQIAIESYEKKEFINEPPQGDYQHIDTAETSEYDEMQEYDEMEESVPNEKIFSKAIQVSANDSGKFAKDNANKLKKEFPNFNVYLYFDESNKKYKIWIGDFESDSDVQLLKQELEKVWRSCFIINVLPEQKQNAIVI